MEEVKALLFKHRGFIEWHRVYKESVKFFESRKYEVLEKRFKDKGYEAEVDWEVVKKIDMYYRMKFTIHIYIIDMHPMTQSIDGKQVHGYFGKARIRVVPDIEEDYEQPGYAGKKKIFKPNSWLHKIYKKATYREKEEFIGGQLFDDGHEYIELLKRLCHMDAKNG